MGVRNVAMGAWAANAANNGDLKKETGAAVAAVYLGLGALALFKGFKCEEKCKAKDTTTATTVKK